MKALQPESTQRTGDKSFLWTCLVAWTMKVSEISVAWVQSCALDRNKADR
jgi:hypothetical protein